jgi:hypothetical protein
MQAHGGIFCMVFAGTFFFVLKPLRGFFPGCKKMSHMGIERVANYIPSELKMFAEEATRQTYEYFSSWKTNRNRPNSSRNASFKATEIRKKELFWRIEP